VSGRWEEFGVCLDFHVAAILLELFHFSRVNKEGMSRRTGM
jgi:hypothetical protein